MVSIWLSLITFNALNLPCKVLGQSKLQHVVQRSFTLWFDVSSNNFTHLKNGKENTLLNTLCITNTCIHKNAFFPQILMVQNITDIMKMYYGSKYNVQVHYNIFICILNLILYVHLWNANNCFKNKCFEMTIFLWVIHHPCCLTISQCLSLMPGLQMVLRMGRCCLNLSTLFLTVSATRRGPAWSLNCLVSLYMVLHMSPTSFSISSEFRFWNGPITNKQTNPFNV